MTSKHHKWQAKWQTTHHADGCISLTHADGLQMLDVPVGQAIPQGARPVAGLAATPANMLRTYTPAGLATVAEWVAAQPSIRDATSRATKQARILREAAAMLEAARQHTTAGNHSTSPAGHSPASTQPTLRKRA